MKHLAIIADGNRRWAVKNNLPKECGYSQALIVIENCCLWAIKNEISYLTFYCFSTENWKRKADEVSYLMELGYNYFIEQKEWYIKKGIKIQFIGRRDRIPCKLSQSIFCLEEETREGKNLILNICLDYGGREEIINAIKAGMDSEEKMNDFLTSYAPEPDLILRTGGQQRLSNFLLWQAAYAELLFIDDYFPELSDNLLDLVLLNYQQRKRNYGG